MEIENLEVTAAKITAAKKWVGVRQKSLFWRRYSHMHNRPPLADFSTQIDITRLGLQPEFWWF